MEQRFILREGNSSLLLFFAGWGSDECLFTRPAAEGYDYLLCFDYRNPDFDYSQLEGYQSIRLLGWSMGVWAASQTFSGKDLPWEMKLAVNGTLTPIHDTTGIPEAIFNGTLDTFSPATLAKFRRRMCGGTEEVKHFLDRQPRRSVEELHEELKALRQEVLRLPVPAFQWDKAIIGTEDRIFPSQNQLEAWQGTPVLSMNIPHYADLFFTECLKGKEQLWTKD